MTTVQRGILVTFVTVLTLLFAPVAYASPFNTDASLIFDDARVLDKGWMVETVNNEYVYDSYKMAFFTSVCDLTHQEIVAKVPDRTVIFFLNPKSKKTDLFAWRHPLS